MSASSALESSTPNNSIAFSSSPLPGPSRVALAKVDIESYKNTQPLHLSTLGRHQVPTPPPSPHGQCTGDLAPHTLYRSRVPAKRPYPVDNIIDPSNAASMRPNESSRRNSVSDAPSTPVNQVALKSTSSYKSLGPFANGNIRDTENKLSRTILSSQERAHDIGKSTPETSYRLVPSSMLDIGYVSTPSTPQKIPALGTPKGTRRHFGICPVTGAVKITERPVCSSSPTTPLSDRRLWTPSKPLEERHKSSSTGGDDRVGGSKVYEINDIAVGTTVQKPRSSLGYMESIVTQPPQPIAAEQAPEVFKAQPHAAPPNRAQPHLPQLQSILGVKDAGTDHKIDIRESPKSMRERDTSLVSDKPPTFSVNGPDQDKSKPEQSEDVQMLEGGSVASPTASKPSVSPTSATSTSMESFSADSVTVAAWNELDTALQLDNYKAEIEERETSLPAQQLREEEAQASERVMPAPKPQRSRPSDLPAIAQTGNFATAASSRSRRKSTLPGAIATTLETTPRIVRPGKRNVPTSPILTSRATSPVNGLPPSPHTLEFTELGGWKLPDFLEPVGKWVKDVPIEVSDQMVKEYVGFYAEKHDGNSPPPALKRRRVRGRYRLPLDSDSPDIADFIILKDLATTYWRENDDDDDESDSDSIASDDSVETVIERWSGGNVKGPKFAASLFRLKNKITAKGAQAPRNIVGIAGRHPPQRKRKKQKTQAKDVDTVEKGKQTTLEAFMGLKIASASKQKAIKKVSGPMTDLEDSMDTNDDTSTASVGMSRPASREATSISTMHTPPSSTLRPRPAHAATQKPLESDRYSAPPMAFFMEDEVIDTDISSDEDVMPGISPFAHRTASTKLAEPTQSITQRKLLRNDAIKSTESGPGSRGQVPGSTSIFSIATLAVPGVGVMGPPAGKVSQAEHKLYIGRKGDSVPLFGSGGNMVVPGLGSGPNVANLATSSSAVVQTPSAGALTQPGGVVEVKRVQDPLLEATMEVRRLIYEGGHQGGLVPGEGILGGLVVEQVYWSGEREKSLTAPVFGLGVEFSGRPLVKALTFSNPLTNYTYTLHFVWAFLPVNTPEKNKENAVGNTMLLSDEIKGDGARDLRSDDVREGFQVHLCVGKPGRVQKKEDRKRLVFVQVLNKNVKLNGKSKLKEGRARAETTELIRWERWELDGLMRGLTRLWEEKLASRTNPVQLVNGNGKGGADAIGHWLEHDVLGLEGGILESQRSLLPMGLKPKPTKLPKKLTGPIVQEGNKPSFPATTTSLPIRPSTPLGTVTLVNGQSSAPIYVQPFPHSGDSLPLAAPRIPLPPPSSPKRKFPTNTTVIATPLSTSSMAAELEAAKRGKHRKIVLQKEMSRDHSYLDISGKLMLNLDTDVGERGIEEMFWWEI